MLSFLIVEDKGLENDPKMFEDFGQEIINTDKCLDQATVQSEFSRVETKDNTSDDGYNLLKTL